MIYRKALNKLAHIDATQRADTRFYEEMQEMLQDTDLYQVEELTQRIKDAIATLPESYREAFVMHRFRDMSYKEIAEILGVSPKTVDYRIQQALKQLRVDLRIICLYCYQFYFLKINQLSIFLSITFYLLKY